MPTFMSANDGIYFDKGSDELELAGVDEHHRRQARDRLGHRMQRKDRVRRHGHAGPDVAHAKALQIEGAAMLLDQDNGARQFAGRYLVVEERGDALELCRHVLGARGSDHPRPKPGRQDSACERTQSSPRKARMNAAKNHPRAPFEAGSQRRDIKANRTNRFPSTSEKRQKRVTISDSAGRGRSSFGFDTLPI